LVGLVKKLALLHVQTIGSRHTPLCLRLSVRFPISELSQVFVNNVMHLLAPKDFGKSFLKVPEKLLKVRHFVKVVPTPKCFAQPPDSGTGAAQGSSTVVDKRLSVLNWTTENGPNHLQGDNLPHYPWRRNQVVCVVVKNRQVSSNHSDFATILMELLHPKRVGPARHSLPPRSKLNCGGFVCSSQQVKALLR
jgi:hypothetical protein